VWGVHCLDKPPLPASVSGECGKIKVEVTRSYCGILVKQYPHTMGASGATIEHFNNDGPGKKYNVAICCRRCNSSKGTKSLSAWFKTPYCREKKINEETVSKPVKEYMRRKRGQNR
jgi:hypothetical protein